MAIEEAGPDVPVNGAMADEREATLAALMAGEHEESEKAAPPAAKKALAKAEPEDEDDDADLTEADDEDDDGVDDDDEDLDEDADEGEDEPEEEDEGAPIKADADTRKRLSAVKKWERRARAQLAEAEAKLRREQEQHAGDLVELEKYRALKARAKHDPDALFDHFGYDEDALELAARAAYARSKGKDDPKLRDSVARTAKERALMERVEALQKRLDEREETEKKQTEAATYERQERQYLDGIAKVAKKAEDYPLVRRRIGKQPDAARREMLGIAQQLAAKLGKIPGAKAVLKRYEKVRRAELEADGVDVEALLKTAAPTKDKNQPAGEERSAKTTSKGNGKSANEPPTDVRELREWTLRQLEAGQFD